MTGNLKRIIVRIKPGCDLSRIITELEKAGLVDARAMSTLNLIAGDIDEAKIAKLHAFDSVASIDIDESVCAIDADKAKRN